MSKPRYKWWGYIKNVIRDYPRLKRWHNELLGETSVIATYGGIGGGRSSGVSDPTYRAVAREMPEQEQREYEAVRQAVEDAAHRRDGHERLEVIRMVLWDGTHTLEGAALAIPVSYQSARDKQAEFIRSVAKKLGYL